MSPLRLLPLSLSFIILNPFSHALSIPGRESTRRSANGINTLSSDEITAFKPYTFYASAAYCQPSATLAWNCGANCDGNTAFIPTASGGDGLETQFWFVGFDSTLNSVIVAHQGTNPSKIVPLIIDADGLLVEPDSNLFPGLDSSIHVHQGFAGSHSRSAPDVLAAVKQTLSAHSASTITTVGHSLGAAIALLDMVYLKLKLPSMNVQFRGYGLPRVGNQAFANYIDATFPGLVTHISNKEDPIPVLPPIDFGYHHPSGEIHIQDNGSWDSCPGQDNGDDLCTAGDVSGLTEIEFHESDHDGPYDGVKMGC